MTIDDISIIAPTSISDTDREFDRLDKMGIFTGRQAREGAGIIDMTEAPNVADFSEDYTLLGLKMAARVGNKAVGGRDYPETYSPLRNTSPLNHRERRRL